MKVVGAVISEYYVRFQLVGRRVSRRETRLRDGEVGG
jgi:hypothetical protein